MRITLLTIFLVTGCFPGPTDPAIENAACWPGENSERPCPPGSLCLDDFECHIVCDWSRDCDGDNWACIEDICVEYSATCNEAEPCTQGFYCHEGACRKNPAFVNCNNDKQDGGETDIDCGGTYCPSCAPGDACIANTDCSSRVCDTDNTCAAPRCDDGVKNGDESDTDCGGQSMACPRCPPARSCYGAADCDSSVCTGETCQEPTCNDGIQNGTESDVDCGVGCPLCADGRPCNSADDCTSGVCDTTCQAATCSDGVHNGSETDVDCGGDCPLPCTEGQGCVVAADCTSNVCDDTCQAPTCSDNVHNGDETDTDCGGPTDCPRCETNAACDEPSDCASGVCGVEGCVEASCGDGLTNGDETDTDCGGSCEPCASGQACVIGDDCQDELCGDGGCYFPWAHFATAGLDFVA